MLDWLSRVVGSRRSLRTAFLVIPFFLILHLLYSWSSRPPISHTLSELGHDDRNKSFGLDNYVKSSYDWGALRPHFPVSSTVALPSGTPLPMPKVQFEFQPESEATRARLDSYRVEVRQTFLKCWRSYRKRAWKRDELTPVSGRGKDTLGGWAATLIDSLDTLWIMGLKHEFKEAVEVVATIDWAKTEATAVNTFETTIRHLGGLLAAYDLSGERVLLMKAIEIGDLLYAGFDRPSQLPGFWLDFEKAKNGGLEGDSRLPLASPGSLSLEFTRLSQLTGDSKYYDAISRVTTLMAAYQNQTRLPGMWPIYVNFQNIDFHGDNHFSLGAMADSAYEYLPKMYYLLSGTEAVYKNMTSSAFKAIKNHMIFRPMLPDDTNDIWFTGDVRVTSSGKPYLNANMQHLSCFAGGMLALGKCFLQNPDKSKVINDYRWSTFGK
jgi:mannosyl-oligosaccharide alpha-1,2-mannosidase